MAAEDDAAKGAGAFVELGSSGLKRFGGYIDEEFLKELKGVGPNGVAVYREMRDNCPVTGAILFVVEMLCRQATVNVEPASEAPEDQEAAAFLQSCLGDMSHTWEDGLTEDLSMLPYGWALKEIVYKRRQGAPGAARSKFDDGRIGGRKLAIRSQDSLLDWQFDDNGGMRAMRQMGAPDYTIRTIPIEKALLFRPHVDKNNPMGRSILRNAYTSYYYRKHFMRIWGIGIERDLNGIPVAWVPPELLGTNATSEMTTTLTQIKKVVTQIRVDEQAGLVFPLAYDENNNKRFDLTLMSTGGRRNFDLVAAMNYLDLKIANTVLADLLLIGHGATGSYALMDSKVELFSQALDAWLAAIAEIYNRFAVPRLFSLNTFRTMALPTIKFGQVAKVSLGEVGALIAQLGQAGAPVFPNQELQDHVYRMADFPVSAQQSTEVGKSAGWGKTLAQSVSKRDGDLFVEAVQELREAIAHARETA